MFIGPKGEKKGVGMNMYTQDLIANSRKQIEQIEGTEFTV